jgi:hypothetical protein
MALALGKLTHVSGGEHRSDPNSAPESVLPDILFTAGLASARTHTVWPSTG